jgi:hypothetical protein
MLGVSPPTMFERIQERNRLNLILGRVRESRKKLNRNRPQTF